MTTQPNVEFVELLTNGSLLKSRLGRLAEYGDIGKVALWATHHHTEISIERFIDNARYAQDDLGCFVVVNGLLFPDNQAVLAELKEAADAAGLRFNLDLGYDPGTAVGAHDDVSSMVPVMRDDRWLADAARLGARSDVLDVNLVGLRGIGGIPCSAGHDYVYIGIDGDVYPCSRYYVLGRGRLGNVLEPGFELPLRADRWTPCGATAGCCNKEDFLHLQMADTIDRRRVPSLGWVGS